MSFSNLYYISQGKTPKDHLCNIKNVCEAGCKLVQLRLKEATFATYLSIAIEANKICNKYEAKLIINDNVEVAKAVNVYGIHLGKNDMNPLQAREVLGSIIIGGTANTYEDCIHLINQKVDYIGLGPFRFTETKQNLSPVIGIGGYRQIIGQLKKENIDIPIVAIGGIIASDFNALFNIGISSIATSGLLTNKPIEELKNIITSGIISTISK